MRTVVVAACLCVASCALSEHPPRHWDPKYWEMTRNIAGTARKHSERQMAEKWCAIGMPYVDASVVDELRNYASLLVQMNDAHAAEGRANAERFAAVTKSHAQAIGPTNNHLGFEPSVELRSYANLLQTQHRTKEGDAMRALADAYQHTQSAYFERTRLIHDGKDPRGEC